MVMGVSCIPRRAYVTFDECINCTRCLPPAIIKTLRIYEYDTRRSTYYVSEIVGCLRKAHYQRKMPKDKYLTLEELYKIKRGTLLERIADSTGWRQLEGSMCYVVDGETVKLTARLDCYDPEKKTIFELKSLVLYDGRVLPREKDKLQIQCYGLIFKDVFSDVKGLKIVYLDMNAFRVYDIKLEDKSEWVIQRVAALHRAVRDSQPPSREESYECRYCEYASECLSQQTPTIHAQVSSDRQT